MKHHNLFKTASTRRAAVFSLFALVLLCGSLLLFPLHFSQSSPILYIRSASPRLHVNLPSIEDGEIHMRPFELRRGMEVRAIAQGESYSRVRVGLDTVDLDNRYLASSLKEALLPEAACAAHDTPIYLNRNATKIAPSMISKGEPLEILDVDIYDYDAANGEAGWYKIRCDSQEGYIRGGAIEWLTSLSQEESALAADPLWQPDWQSNPKQEDIHALNVSLEQLLANEAFIVDYLHANSLNSLIVTLKDTDGLPDYKSETFDEYFAHTDTLALQQENCPLSFEELCDLVSRLKQQGIYMTARLDVFTDNALGTLMPDSICAISDYGTHMRADDPSVWCYIGRLETEAVKAGFQEILLDSVLPDDGTAFEQVYPADETLASFLKTNREALEEHHVYFSVMVPPDLFYESENPDTRQILDSLFSSTHTLYTYPWLINLQQHPENFGIEVFFNARSVISHFVQCASGSNPEGFANLVYSLQGFGLMSPETLREQLLGLRDGGIKSFAINTIDGHPDRLLPLQSAFYASDTAEILFSDQDTASTQSSQQN